jgi:hypothetical protein
MDEIEKQLAAPELIFERGEPPDATYVFKRGPARASDRLKAGQHAIEQSANAEAIGHLMRSLELLGSLPRSPKHLQSALGLQAMLGQAMIAQRI